jgi:hypothetical protein
MGLASPRAQLLFEGGVMLVASVVAYWATGGNWLLFAALLLAPDLSMLGYLLGPGIGAAIYNLAHMALWPTLLIFAGWLGGQHLALPLGLIWLCHLGMDRALGFGFKYPTAFKDTHLQRV